MRNHRFFNILCLAALGVLMSAIAWSQVSLKVNRTITVAATGTPAENCQALRSVLNGITDSSSSNPYHVRLEPGVYSCGNLGSTPITVPPFVVLEGAGIDATPITGTVLQDSTGLIDLKDGSELRFLTVINECAGSPSFCPAVGARNSPVDTDISARVSHIRAMTLPGCTDSNCGFAIVTTHANSVVQLAIDSSYVEGSRHAIACNSFTGTGSDEFLVTESQLVATSGESLVTFCAAAERMCANSFDVNFDPVGKNCLPIP